MRTNVYEKYNEIIYDIIEEWENNYWDHAYSEKVIDRIYSVYGDGEPVVIVYGITGKILDIIPPEKELLGLPNISDVHKRLRTLTGVKVSESTTKKCLDYLISEGRIYRKKASGWGGARRVGVTYCGLRPGEGGQVQASLKIIAEEKEKLPQELCKHIKDLEGSLLRALERYADARVSGEVQADENYKANLDRYFLEYMYQLRLLVEPPHTPTVDQFHHIRDILAGRVKQEEEWVRVKITKLGISTQK